MPAASAALTAASKFGFGVEEYRRSMRAQVIPAAFMSAKSLFMPLRLLPQYSANGVMATPLAPPAGGGVVEPLTTSCTPSAGASREKKAKPSASVESTASVTRDPARDATADVTSTATHVPAAPPGKV